MERCKGRRQRQLAGSRQRMLFASNSWDYFPNQSTNVVSGAIFIGADNCTVLPESNSLASRSLAGGVSLNVLSVVVLMAKR